MRSAASRADLRKRRGQSFAALTSTMALLGTLIVANPVVAVDVADEGFRQWENATELDNRKVARNLDRVFFRTHRAVRAHKAWARGYTGTGVDIALIDTGVVPVDGLTTPGKVVNGPDLSFESQADNLQYLDTHGHGTHLAGLMAGLSDDADLDGGKFRIKDAGGFAGIAPGARIVNLKVADVQGAVDVTQVIAAIDWVIQHRTDNDLDIKVLLLAYGTDSTQAYEIDPLAHVVQRAWDAGIVVVAAAGNDGGTLLRNPATNPYVIAVGAVDTKGTNKRRDDTIPAFSNCGTDARQVDLVAPGKSILSLRNPGSRADAENPQSVVAGDLFLGSGTSQAAAIVAGGAALLLDRWPGLTPDQVKYMLMESAARLPNAGAGCQGAGMLNLKAAMRMRPPDAQDARQSFPKATGLGALESARGSNHVADEGVVLEGEIDIMGNEWNGYCTETEDGLICADTLWDGGDFNGASWSGASWSGASWSGASWSGASWSGASWSGASWSGKTWTGASWSGASWSGASWSGASWSGGSWSGASWSGLSWN